MPRRKLEHYKFSAEAENVIEAGKPLYTSVKGRWNELYFKNDNPIVVELACGKGEYTVGFGSLFPDRNFIGMDIKGDRIARGSVTASALKLANVAFLRAGIRYSDEFFAEGELDSIWIVHPDPQVRERDENKRLTNPAFLNQYGRFLRKGGSLFLKTDSSFLYDYSIEVIEHSDAFDITGFTDDLYNSEFLQEHHDVKTHYERLFVNKGHTIKYIRAVSK